MDIPFIPDYTAFPSKGTERENKKGKREDTDSGANLFRVDKFFHIGLLFSTPKVEKQKRVKPENLGGDNLCEKSSICKWNFGKKISPALNLIFQKVTRISCFERWGSPRCAPDNSTVSECCRRQKCGLPTILLINY
jgi:hypothetical protein